MKILFNPNNPPLLKENPSSLQPKSELEKLDNKVIVIRKYAKVLFKKYSDLLSSCTITLLDLFFLFGEISKSFPAKISNISFLMLNFSGFLPFYFYLDQTRKYVNDFTFSHINKNNNVKFGSVLRIFVISLTMIIILFGCIASIFKSIGYKNLMIKTFLVLKPFGIVCVILSIFLDIYYYYLNKKIISTKKISDNDINLMFSSYNNKKTLVDKDLAYKTSLIKNCMDKDTWHVFMKNIKPLKPNDVCNKRKLYDVCIQNIETQNFVAKSDIFLRIIGYIGMFIAHCYPGGIIQASIWTAMSSFYTIQIAIQKYRQALQQKRVRLITQ